MIVTPFAQVSVLLVPPVASAQGELGALPQLSTALATGPGQSQDRPQQRGRPGAWPGQHRQVQRGAGPGRMGEGSRVRGVCLSMGSGGLGQVGPSDVPVRRQALLGTPPRSSQPSAPTGMHPTPAPGQLWEHLHAALRLRPIVSLRR